MWDIWKVWLQIAMLSIYCRFIVDFSDSWIGDVSTIYRWFNVKLIKEDHGYMELYICDDHRGGTDQQECTEGAY